jgi:hypothetical protein
VQLHGSFSLAVRRLAPEMGEARARAQCNIQDLLFELRKINCLACIIDEGSSQAKMMACHGEISIRTVVVYTC